MIISTITWEEKEGMLVSVIRPLTPTEIVEYAECNTGIGIFNIFARAVDGTFDDGSNKRKLLSMCNSAIQEFIRHQNEMKMNYMQELEITSETLKMNKCDIGVDSTTLELILVKNKEEK